MIPDSAPAGVPLPVAPTREADTRIIIPEPRAKQALVPAADPIADVPLRPMPIEQTEEAPLLPSPQPPLVQIGLVVGIAIVLALLAWGIAHLLRKKLTTLRYKNALWFVIGILIALGAVSLEPVIGRALFPSYGPPF